MQMILEKCKDQYSNWLRKNYYVEMHQHEILMLKTVENGLLIYLCRIT